MRDLNKHTQFTLSSGDTVQLYVLNNVEKTMCAEADKKMTPEAADRKWANDSTRVDGALDSYTVVQIHEIAEEVRRITSIVMYGSDEAASYHTNISGWVDRHGKFWGDEKGAEEMARRAGSTHIPCPKCKRPKPTSGFIHCEKCRDKTEIANYANMPHKDWDGEVAIYSQRYDFYIFSRDEWDDRMIDEEMPDQLRFVICNPIVLDQISEDQWIDDIPEESDLPISVIEAIADLNQALVEATDIGWIPGEFRTSVTPQNKSEPSELGDTVNDLDRTTKIS